MSELAHTPGPLDLLCSSTPSANGKFHLYVADASGRKLGACWGGNDEKLANGYLWTAAPDLLDGCNALLGLIELVTQRDDMPETIRNALRTSHRVDEARSAIRKATQQ